MENNHGSQNVPQNSQPPTPPSTPDSQNSYQSQPQSVQSPEPPKKRSSGLTALLIVGGVFLFLFMVGVVIGVVTGTQQGIKEKNQERTEQTLQNIAGYYRALEPTAIGEQSDSANVYYYSEDVEDNPLLRRLLMPTSFYFSFHRGWDMSYLDTLQQGLTLNGLEKVREVYTGDDMHISYYADNNLRCKLQITLWTIVDCITNDRYEKAINSVADISALLKAEKNTSVQLMEVYWYESLEDNSIYGAVVRPDTDSGIFDPRYFVSSAGDNWEIIAEESEDTGTNRITSPRCETLKRRDLKGLFDRVTYCKE